MKTALESIVDYMEERISDLEDRNLEMIQVEEKRELLKKLQKFYQNYLIPLRRAV